MSSNRIRILFVSLLAVFVSSALMVSVASAAETPEWWVAGSLLKGSEALAETTKVTEPFRLPLTIEHRVAATIKCGNVRLKNAQIENTNERSEEAVVYEKCEVEGMPTCEVKEPVVTAPLKARLEGSTGAIKLRFKPKSGTEIATYHLSACGSLTGSFRASGEMICNYKGVETEKEEHPLEFTATSGSKVEVNGEPSEFSGTDVVHLASGKLWSASG
jgi:hypothetical protein